MQWYNCRSLIWLRVFEISSGDAAPPQVVESQDIKPRAALHLRGLLGYHAIRGHVKKGAAPSHAQPCHDPPRVEQQRGWDTPCSQASPPPRSLRPVLCTLPITDRS